MFSTCLETFLHPFCIFYAFMQSSWMFLTDVFFHHPPGDHDLMSTALAFQAEIRSHPQHFPLSGTTGVLFLQFYHITDLNVHNTQPFSFSQSDCFPYAWPQLSCRLAISSVSPGRFFRAAWPQLSYRLAASLREAWRRSLRCFPALPGLPRRLSASGSY